MVPTGRGHGRAVRIERDMVNFENHTQKTHDDAYPHVCHDLYNTIQALSSVQTDGDGRNGRTRAECTDWHRLHRAHSPASASDPMLMVRSNYSVYRIYELVLSRARYIS